MPVLLCSENSEHPFEWNIWVRTMSILSLFWQLSLGSKIKIGDFLMNQRKERSCLTLRINCTGFQRLYMFKSTDCSAGVCGPFCPSLQQSRCEDNSLLGLQGYPLSMWVFRFRLSPDGVQYSGLSSCSSNCYHTLSRSPSGNSWVHLVDALGVSEHISASLGVTR